MATLLPIGQQATGAHSVGLRGARLARGLYTVRLVHDGAAEYRKLVVE